VDVSASGNLQFSTQEDLAFEMAGTVEDIFVEEGDAVNAGQVVATLDTSDWEEQLRSLKMSVLSSEVSLKQAEMSLEDAERETETSITGDVVVWCCPDDDEIEIKEMQVEQSKLRLEDAQAQLDEHLAQSPEVVAPFDGFVTQVSAEGGDEVFKGTVAVTIVDPSRFEASILVSENDISKVSEGTQAYVEIDSMSGVTLPAEVSAIAPTATISSGVVNYQVTVDVATLDEARALMQRASASQPNESGSMPEQLREAVESGELTQDEAEAMIAGGAGKQMVPDSDIEGIDLREGLSVSVTLLIAEKTDVLLVPNAAISKAGNRAFVTVILEDGGEEQRSITTGVSNWQYTEVLDGLEEGDVIKTVGTVAAGGGPERPGGLVSMRGHP
jgi:HlyD family secretion protein